MYTGTLQFKTHNYNMISFLKIVESLDEITFLWMFGKKQVSYLESCNPP